MTAEGFASAPPALTRDWEDETGWRAIRTAYRLRLKRRRLLWRALRKRRQLKQVADRTEAIQPDSIIAFVMVRNEMERLPYFLTHYRQLGVNHFIFVDNASSDQTSQFLAGQKDCSVWATESSYRLSRFGLDWITWLMVRFGHGHWCLTLDADELLVYPHSETRPLPALTEWLDRCGLTSFPAMMLDLYPKGALGGQRHDPEADPTKVLNWFDGGNYTIQRQLPMENLWIQGGPRAREFFSSDPRRAPTMNKTPLVKWNRRVCLCELDACAAAQAVEPRLRGNG